MECVDRMKTLQHWDNTSVTQYHEMAVRGEHLLLRIRYGGCRGVSRG
jgi:hypothetical protein